MPAPVFVRVRDALVNLSICTSILREGDTLTFTTAEDYDEYEYETEDEAKRALEEIQRLLEARSLLVGSVA